MALKPERKRAIEKAKARALAELARRHPVEFEVLFSEKLAELGERPRNPQWVAYGKMYGRMAQF